MRYFWFWFCSWSLMSSLSLKKIALIVQSYCSIFLKRLWRGRPKAEILYLPTKQAQQNPNPKAQKSVTLSHLCSGRSMSWTLYESHWQSCWTWQWQSRAEILPVILLTPCQQPRDDSQTLQATNLIKFKVPFESMAYGLAMHAACYCRSGETAFCLKTSTS